MAEHTSADDPDLRRAEGCVDLMRDVLAGRVAFDVAHDVNNLLFGLLYAAGETPAQLDPAKLAGALEIATESGRRIAELVGSFQTLFNRSAGAWRAQPRCIRDAIELPLSFCRTRLAARCIDIREDIGDLPRVCFGVESLQQIVLHLVYVALDAMPDGGVLRLSAEQRGSDLAVDVACEPHGLSEERATDGEGGSVEIDAGPSGAADADAAGRSQSVRDLLLAAARAVARQHGGELTAQHTLGAGPRFIVRTPLGERNGGP